MERESGGSMRERKQRELRKWNGSDTHREEQCKKNERSNVNNNNLKKSPEPPQMIGKRLTDS